MIHNYFVIDTQKTIVPIYGAVSFSTGDGLDLSSRYGYDYSKKPQSLIYRKRNTALTATVQMAFTPSFIIEKDKKPFDYIADLEESCGKKVDFYWNGQPVGSFVIQSIQFALTTDVYAGFSQCSVSISMTEAYKKRGNLAEVAVSTL